MAVCSGSINPSPLTTDVFEMACDKRDKSYKNLIKIENVNCRLCSGRLILMCYQLKELCLTVDINDTFCSSHWIF